MIQKSIRKHKIMLEENVNQEFRLKKAHEIRNYLIQEINWNIRKILNYIKHLLIAIFTITGCVSISAFTSLVGIPIGITSSAIGLKICVITARIKNS